MFIPVILGTAREGRFSEKAANFVFEEVKKAGHETILIDVKNYMWGATIPPWTPNPKTNSYREIISKADALIIVSPEYNHGYPGELKILLDAALDEYTKKPVAFCGVSSGGLGGVRAVEQLRQIAVNYGLVNIPLAVYFSNIEKLFDEKGMILDQSYLKRVENLIAQLVDWKK